MSRKIGGRFRIGAGAACLLALLAAPAGPARCGAAALPAGRVLAATAQLQPAPAIDFPAPGAIAGAPGGWRPKRPLLCAGAVLATGVMGGVLSTVPFGTALAVVTMIPFLVDACG